MHDQFPEHIPPPPCKKLKCDALGTHIEGVTGTAHHQWPPTSESVPIDSEVGGKILGPKRPNFGAEGIVLENFSDFSKNCFLKMQWKAKTLIYWVWKNLGFLDLFNHWIFCDPPPIDSKILGKHPAKISYVCPCPPPKKNGNRKGGRKTIIEMWMKFTWNYIAAKEFIHK